MSAVDNSFTENTFGDLSYTFLEPVPNFLTCIICFGLLKDAVATDCCGKMFCTQHSSRTGDACPACRHTPLAVTRNKGIDSIVDDLKVFCQHHEEGCPWTGHLCFESNHRNTKCNYEMIFCNKGCGAGMQRKQMDTHLLKDCPRRQVKCDFCALSVIAAELKTHYESCLAFPVECPHGCELTLPRKEVEEHSSTCPEVHVPCPFAAAGCSHHVKNKDLATHVQASIMEHLSLVFAQNIALQKKLATVGSQQEASEQAQKALQCELHEVSKENVSLREQLQSLEREHTAIKRNIECELRLVNKRYDELNKDLCTLTTHGRELGESVAHLEQSAHSHWRTFLVQASTTRSEKLPMICRYGEVKEDMASNNGRYSPSFYISDRGYRLCLAWIPSGLSSTRGWMSVTVVILPGDHDRTLQWDMQGSLKVEVLNQSGDNDHYSKEIDFERFPRKYRERAQCDPRDSGAAGWGILRFISHRDLFEGCDGHRYVVDGAIYFRITGSS